MADDKHGLVYREGQRWSLKFRCVLLVLILLIVSVGIFGAVTTVMDDSARFAAWVAIAFCAILMPLSVGLLIWADKIEIEVLSDR